MQLLTSETAKHNESKLLPIERHSVVIKEYTVQKIKI